jgi:hypothetical protein
MPELNVATLRDLEARGSALLGDRYESMVAERSKGMDHARTPPKNPHRLVNNLRRLAGSRQSMEHGGGPIDVAVVVEVNTLLNLLEPWRKAPNWPAILAALVDADSYAHTVVLLLVEKTYRDLGTLVTLEPPTVDRRSFDLCVLAAGGQSLALEVKAPRQLRQDSNHALTAKEADKIVTAAMDSAGPSGGGQLSPERCGILVIGGFARKLADMKTLHRAGSALFRKRTLSHIGAILFISMGLHLKDVQMVNGVPRPVTGSKASMNLYIELCRNPKYLGAIEISDGRPNGWDPLGPFSEAQAHDHPALSRFR